MTSSGRLRWSPSRRAVLDSIAEQLKHNYGRGRVIVAVDGARDADRVAFADDLAEAMRTRGLDVFRASMNDFLRPRAEREVRGRDSAAGRYEDAFDYSVLRRVLLEPFRMSGSTGFVTAAWDAEADRQIEPKWLTGPADAVLILDGPYLGRPELRGLWNASVWLDGVADADPVASAAQALYEKTRPRDQATIVVDVTNPDSPRQILTDAC
jgi:uridine kinase